MTWTRVASDFRKRFNNPSPLVSGGRHARRIPALTGNSVLLNVSSSAQ
jgi:hypothetical protein